MTLQELLDDIDGRFSNPFTQAQKINWINITQREIFREMALKEILQFNTIADQALYDLKTLSGNNLEFEMIESVTLDNKKYAPKFINDEAVYYSYYKVLDNYIGFYPVPKKSDLIVNIYYEKRPETLSSSNLTKTPDLREDYLEILKYGVFVIMAKALKDVALANNYVGEYNDMMKKIKQEKYEKMSKYPQTQDVMNKARNRYYPKRRKNIIYDISLE
ncbi:hypothetical protein [Anaerosolibacter sp.]|uniref:phage adaptor protein n=1 Tax=Anaerosolibacter sp. TaxID=1872527 RepID=UPI0039EFEAFC